MPLVMDLLPATSCANNNLFHNVFNICPNPSHNGMTQMPVPQTSPSTVYKPIQSVISNTNQYPPRFHDSPVDQFGHPSQVSCKMLDMPFSYLDQNGSQCRNSRVIEVEKTSCQDLSLVHKMDVVNNTEVVRNPSTLYNLAVVPNSMSIRPTPSSPEYNPNQLDAGNTAQVQRQFYDSPIGKIRNLSQVMSCRMSDALFFYWMQNCPPYRHSQVIKLGKTSGQSIRLGIEANANEAMIRSISRLYNPLPNFRCVLQAAERCHPKTKRIAEGLKNRVALILGVTSCFLIALVFYNILPGDYFFTWPSHIGIIFGLSPTPRVVRRKAVLVAISYNGQLGEPLPAPLNELPKVEKFLMERYNVAAEDIVILSDDPSKKHIRPTRENILEQLTKLVAGAAPGDLLFFWYNGHGGQVDNKNGTESDKRDEFIRPVDVSEDKTKPSLSRDRYKNIILDDELRDILVSHLPTSVHLVALIDSCHSGTMLDLRFTLSVDGMREELQTHSHKWPSEGHAMSISASFDGQQAWQQKDARRSLLTKAFLQTLSENPSQTIRELLMNLDTLISKDLKGAHKQDPQMGFNYPPNDSDVFSI
ncbi:caspase domain-containing protein [Hysterangium stoloniferum]|nr:caspase domain-containing protein [Hysterangium stoloniferum]